MLLGTSAQLRRRPSRTGNGDSVVLAAYSERPRRLRAVYKGRVLKALVLRNGLISCGGKRYKSPTAAARATMPTRRTVNGWTFWEFERAPGDWVRLKELRR
jgi:hypothetical protein